MGFMNKLVGLALFLVLLLDDEFSSVTQVCCLQVRVIGLFGSVWGIGPVTAQKLYDQGHRSLEDLKTDTSLTPPQRYGLKFHFDIIKKIPRDEVKAFFL